MPEPTIDEMLAWANETESYRPLAERRYFNAIRAILEQHHAQLEYPTKCPFCGMPNRELEAVRAFVERVQLSELDWQEAMLTELAEMEEAANT